MPDHQDLSLRPVTIEKLVSGGYGLGVYEGKKGFIRGAYPGELVLARVVEEKKQIWYGQAVEIQKPSPHRRQSPCVYSDECGGCPWIDLEEESQRTWKTRILLETFRRLGGIPFMEDELEVLEGTPFNYRSRAQVHWDGTHLGFKARRSESVIPIKHCMVLTENLNQVWDQDLTQFSLQSRTRIMECNTGIKSRGLAEVSLAGLTLQVNAEGFFQSNRLVQTRLINLLRDRLQGETLLDLYGGVGVFAAALASNFKKIWLVESQKESADCARKNLKATGARIFSGTVEAWARSFPKTQMDWVIVDPPRQGLKTKALAMLAQQTPQKIAYISCNPDTQARDLKALHHAGYALDELFLLDFYPQTPHIETLAILSYDSPPKDTTYV